MDEIVTHSKSVAINEVILEEFDDDQIQSLAVAVSHGTLDIGWDNEGQIPTFDLTDKYWRFYDRLIFGK